MKSIKKLSAGQLREKLSGFNRKGLEGLIGEMYRNCPAACDYLSIRLGGTEYEQALLEDAKKQVQDCFFTRGGRGKLGMKAAKDIVQSFENVCQNPGSTVELRMCVVENMSEIAHRYSNLPASFYRDAEAMLRSAITRVNESKDDQLTEKVRKQMDDILQSVRFSEGGLYESFRNISQGMSTGKTEDDTNRKGEIQSTGKKEIQWSVSLKNSGKSLSADDLQLFFRLLYSLANSVNRKLKIHEGVSFEYGKEIEDITVLRDILKRVWEDPSLIDEYLLENGGNHSEEESRIIAGWKGAIHDRFILERHLKNGSIFISYQAENVYLVKGLASSWDDLFAAYPMPMMLETTLLPFRDIVVTDGIFNLFRIHFGAGIAKDYKDTYMTAKRKGEVMDEI